MKREEPHKHPDSLHYSQRKKRRGLLKTGGWGEKKKNSSNYSVLPGCVVHYTIKKKTHVFISALSAVSCVPTGQPLQRLGFVLRQSIFEKKNNKKTLQRRGAVCLCVCVCARAACGFGYLKRQNAQASPPVSGNILAPLHGFNGRDMEYDLKANATSVRNWTCLKKRERDHNSQRRDDRAAEWHPLRLRLARDDSHTAVLSRNRDTRHRRKTRPTDVFFSFGIVPIGISDPCLPIWGET